MVAAERVRPCDDDRGAFHVLAVGVRFAVSVPVGLVGGAGPVRLGVHPRHVHVDRVGAAALQHRRLQMVQGRRGSSDPFDRLGRERSRAVRIVGLGHVIHPVVGVVRVGRMWDRHAVVQHQAVVVQLPRQLHLLLGCGPGRQALAGVGGGVETEQERLPDRETADRQDRDRDDGLHQRETVFVGCEAAACGRGAWACSSDDSSARSKASLSCQEWGTREGAARRAAPLKVLNRGADLPAGADALSGGVHVAVGRATAVERSCGTDLW